MRHKYDIFEVILSSACDSICKLSFIVYNFFFTFILLLLYMLFVGLFFVSLLLQISISYHINKYKVKWKVNNNQQKINCLKAKQTYKYLFITINSCCYQLDYGWKEREITTYNDACQIVWLNRDFKFN
jgi:hypothetical protein